MSTKRSDELNLEAQLKEKLVLLRPTPERDEQSILNGRERFLLELDAMPGIRSRSKLGWLASLIKSIQRKEDAMSRGTHKFAFTTVIAMIVVVLMLFGSASATAYASQSALPGDALYGVKTTMEQTRIALSRDAYSRAQLHLIFAQRRMDEIVELLQQGRYNDVETASSEFDSYIQNVMDTLQTVIAGDPARGAALSEQVTRTLLVYTHKLQDILANTPEPVRPAVERILMASEHGAGEEIEIIGVVVSISDTYLQLDSIEMVIAINDFTEMKDIVNRGDTVKVHAIVAADGTLNAREIELFVDFNEDDFGNDDGNGNDNDGGNDDNGNDNSDEDDGNNNGDDDDGNENGEDDVGNDNDDDGNENGEDDIGNDNDDDDGNDNGEDDDGNDNGDDRNDNDDDGNDNDDNENDNDDNENDSDNDDDDNDNDDDD